MTNTKEKLLEAKYFLERMIENQAEQNAFKYNLSAFWAAFRSVTMFMQKEFNKVPGFAAWYQAQQKKMKADDRMRLSNNRQTVTIHQQPLQPRAHGTVVERHDSPPSQRLATPAKTETTVQWHWYFSEIPDIDVALVCQECMTKLEAIVSECERRFSSS